MTQVLSTTYQEEAVKWFSKLEPKLFQDEEGHVLNFAKHLDGFAVLDDKLQILAYQKSREIDYEVLIEFSKHIPKEKVEEIIRGVHLKHKHSK